MAHMYVLRRHVLVLRLQLINIYKQVLGQAEAQTQS